MITNKDGVLSVHCANNIAGAKRNIYKYTKCGAWLEFQHDGIIVGSIVEGSENGTESFDFKYPFKEEDYDLAIAEIERQADVIWEWANTEREDGETDEERGCDWPLL